ncbi:hypothetical protein [Pseudomonas sp. BN411]|uniref:hypothetical protein n=1 Tax=Pseudomonas sp. BN411 TaxID=2567887 RepID=UPI0024559F51|nr:hypothetical protein [Pseudomonas sp. BN411]MDH4560225.1 hypothetical protein [Pseudomonas sp. BN411]
MSTLTIEGWCKTSTEQRSTPVEDIQFYLTGNDHLRLEQAEEHLQKSHLSEVMVDVDMADQAWQKEIHAYYQPARPAGSSGL